MATKKLSPAEDGTFTAEQDQTQPQFELVDLADYEDEQDITIIQPNSDGSVTVSNVPDGDQLIEVRLRALKRYSEDKDFFLSISAELADAANAADLTSKKPKGFSPKSIGDTVAFLKANEEFYAKLAARLCTQWGDRTGITSLELQSESKGEALEILKEVITTYFLRKRKLAVRR